MPSIFGSGKSSSKDPKKKASKEGFIDILHRIFRSPEAKLNSTSGASRRHCNDTVSEIGSLSRVASRSPSPSKRVARCQSFAARPPAQPLPLPDLQPSGVGRSHSGLSVQKKPRSEKSLKPFLPRPRPACIRGQANTADNDGDLITASVSSESSIDSDDPGDSNQRSPQATDCENGATTSCSPSSMMFKDQKPAATQVNSRDSRKPANLSLGHHISPASSVHRPIVGQTPNLQILNSGAFCSAPDSSMSSPSRSPLRAFGTEQVINSAFWCGKHYADVTLLGSGHCSSPGSGHNSGHNSMGGDMSGQLFWQQSRGSPEYSPLPSPRMTSPGPASRIHSGAVTPIHPRSGVAPVEPHWPDDGKQQSHRLPLPPVIVPNSLPFSHSNSAATSPSVPRSPGRSENPTSPISRFKKGKLLGRGTFGHVYVGFNSESGEMCAMKEVTLFSDDAKSKESAKQLMQEITLLSRLQHPNIVQYYGSETVDDKLYIYLEYVSGGSIYKILQEYGQLGEVAIRSYTYQILSGLAYLHAKHTVHRDIKGANILVDPNGRVKLADFGMAKHIAGQSCPLSFKGSPYWMAPEVIKNSSGCSLAVDIWSLGCTVLEMATTKPPWSQYEGVAAMFKIGNSKELPEIPDHLSEEGKDFIRQCLQRNPLHRPTAEKLLDHAFVKFSAPIERVERTVSGPELSDPSTVPVTTVRSTGIGQSRSSTLDSERLAIHSSRITKPGPLVSDSYVSWNISCPVSPIGSPLLHARSPTNFNGRMSPSPISSPRTASGSCTPLTGANGAIPFHQVKQFYMNEGFGNKSKIQSGSYITGGATPPYHDSGPEIFRGIQSNPRIFSELTSSSNDAKQSVLTDRVSRQLLRDQVKVNLHIDVGPKARFQGRSNGA